MGKTLPDRTFKTEYSKRKRIKTMMYDEEVYEAYKNIVGEEYYDKEKAEEDYQGKWDSDEDFVRDLLEQTGELPKDLPSYIHIDWEWTAKEIMYDYAEDNGHYFRNT